jgi:hypothetical protein
MYRTVGDECTGLWEANVQDCGRRMYRTVGGEYTGLWEANVQDCGRRMYRTVGGECTTKNYVHFLNSESPTLLEFSDGPRRFSSRKTSIISQNMSTQTAEHIGSGSKVH